VRLQETVLETVEEVNETFQLFDGTVTHSQNAIHSYLGQGINAMQTSLSL
jgi:hypothetical protein